ncbi:ornithine cyclodeaminase [Corynebacterium sp. 13CS0277]|uniref:ornithine cyclodeaminase family protein n=1 Tax=Corynebacterium sp. 13CS0277 TaxID=2071994 RepID=UPI000D0351B5|nr:ornithine cyclodeaminase family protein [Corynebacterium sp. 13CS0277]PRQ10415.1 ornithine cyclodeaminase [Corynebacterium sp. 13CS0277]
MPQPTFIDADTIRRLLTPSRARRTLHAALAGDFDPADDPARTATEVGTGQLLAMPSALGDWVGCKLATVAPGNPSHELPLIQASYVLFDRETLTPTAVLEGASLTEIRTPAMSAVAADLLAPATVGRAVIFGTGVQARAHALALHEVRAPEDIRIVGRSSDKVQALVDDLRAQGIPAAAGVAEDVAGAELIACCTASSEPLFDGSLVADGACVIAMGSHTPDARELDGPLMGRSLVAVESLHTAAAEAGDCIQAIAEGHLDADSIVTVRQLAHGEVQRATDRPNVFKGTGMSWQDVAAAAAVYEAL